MRLLPLVLLLLLPRCGEDATTPPDNDKPVCPDQPLADLNSLFGDLAALLYRVDVGQSLLVKGATDRFQTTVAGHDATYEKQEVHDITTAIWTLATVRDSVYALLDSIEGLAADVDPDDRWSPLFLRWRESIESALEYGDTLFALAESRAAGILSELAAIDFSPERIAIECRMERIGPGYEDVATFLTTASRNDRIDILPAFVTCLLPIWGDEWFEFVQSIIEAGSSIETPFWGSVGLHWADQIARSETGWEHAEGWAGGGGVVRIDLTAATDLADLRGAGIAVLIPEEGPPGSYYQPFWLKLPAALERIPSGRYRLLLLASATGPRASDPFAVDEGDSVSISFRYEPLIDEACVLEGGYLPASVFDPSDEAHLGNPCNCPCATEVWEGEILLQALLPEDSTHQIHSEGSFQFVVDCWDQTLSGTGQGTLSIIPRGSPVCTYTQPEPDEFPIQVEGTKQLPGIALEITYQATTYLTTVSCPGDTARVVDVTWGAVSPTGSLTLFPDDQGHAEFVLTVGAGPEYDFFIRTQIDRIF